MKYLKRYTITGIFFVLITGSLAHFLYDWSGMNHFVGFFAPVSESVWEHMKLLFFPMLLYAVFMILKFRKKYPCITAAFCLGISVGTVLIPLFYYAYTSVLGKNLFLLDISTFILSTLAAFWLSYRLTLSCKLKSCTFLPCIFLCILFVCFLIFTYHPPDAVLFQDPTVSKTG